MSAAVNAEIGAMMKCRNPEEQYRWFLALATSHPNDALLYYHYLRSKAQTVRGEKL